MFLKVNLAIFNKHLRDVSSSEQVTTSPFLYLTLDLPAAPLFQVSVCLCVCVCVSLFQVSVCVSVCLSVCVLCVPHFHVSVCLCVYLFQVSLCVFVYFHVSVCVCTCTLAYIHRCTFLQDELERNSIPQIPLSELLSKFNGAAEKVPCFKYMYRTMFQI